MILKNKFSLFNKNKTNNVNIGNSSITENINQNSSWFQSMEPINYAKKNSEKLYEIEEIILNEPDKTLFRKHLFKNLKKDFDNKKEWPDSFPPYS